MNKISDPQDHACRDRYICEDEEQARGWRGSGNDVSTTLPLADRTSVTNPLHPIDRLGYIYESGVNQINQSQIMALNNNISHSCKQILKGPRGWRGLHCQGQW
jgi:hypothetical protein